MTERTATIKLRLDDQIGNRLLEIRKQRDALLAKSKISLSVDAEGMEQAQRAAVRARQASNDAVRDMGLLGAAIGSKAVGPTAQYTALLGAALVTVQKLGPGMVTALQKVSVEFQRQRTLAQFWGATGYLGIGVDRFKSSLSAFTSTSGAGFTKWLQNTSVALSQYRTGLAASAAAMIGVGAAAALSSKHAQNYIKSTLNTRLMYRKLSDPAGAEAWVQGAQEVAWSPGRESRMGIFQSILSKNPYLGQQRAQTATEDIEKFYFSNSELLRSKGFDSAEALASAMSEQNLSGEMSQVFEDVFGLGFSKITPQARFGRLASETKGMDMGQVVAERPEQAMALKLGKGIQGLGDVTMGPLNAVLGMLLKVADAAGKIPGLPQAVGWGIVLTGVGAAGLTVLSMLASLAPALGMVIGLVTKASLVTKGLALAQWALNIAMTANPLGLAIVAVAALVAGLYILEKKFGVVTKAWNALKGGLAAAGNAFREGGGMGVMKLAVDAIVANHPMLKLFAFMVDFLKKIWANSATLNKILSGAAAIWQQIGGFFSWLRDGLGNIISILTTLKDTLAEKLESVFGKAPEVDQAALLAKAKGMKFDDGKNVFDMSDETMKAALEEARTGKPQEHANMAEPAAYDRLVNTFRNMIENPSEGLGDLAPEGNAANPFYNRAFTNSIKGPGGIELRTKPAEEITGSADVEGGLQMLARKGYDFLFGPKMAAGGPITGSGSLIGHSGEEITPASAVVGAKTTLERMNEAAAGGQGGFGAGVNVNAPITVNIGTVSKDVDIDRLISKISNEGADKLVFALRSRLESANVRGIGYLRG